MQSRSRVTTPFRASSTANDVITGVHLGGDGRRLRGWRYGGAALEDALDSDALIRGFDGLPMGAATDMYQARLGGTTWADQDEFAAESRA